ncbi:MAG: hypothetical protein F4Z82_06115 [Caldilineaceae bacterium SB0668_bin_21]|nr:hypothetical protein [Caldilineaceae bacterium SB0668_bin_21]MYC21387.1 hypothetical protein [Caldilineaceae bacterium SB0662_bin_25]
MTFDEFKASLSDDAPPEGVGAPLRALWLDAANDWDGAHDALQGQPDLNGSAWVHAYLHRVEGDLPNANGWYRRAQKPASSASLPEEWEEIARALLED